MKAPTRFSRVTPLALTLVGLLLWRPVAGQTPRHNSFGIEGMKVRVQVPFAPSGKRVIFQEIVPCRLVDTREDRLFDPIHGAPRFSGGETRLFPVSGALPDANGCSLYNRRPSDPDATEIPTGVLGLSVRIAVINSELPPAAGVLWAGPQNLESEYGFAFWFGYVGNEIANFQEGMVAAETPGDVLRVGLLPGAGAHVLIDVLGYYQIDPISDVGPAGPKGDKGEQGDPGASTCPQLNAGSGKFDSCAQVQNPSDIEKVRNSVDWNCTATITVPGFTPSCQVSVYYVDGTNDQISVTQKANGSFTVQGKNASRFAWVTLCCGS